MNETRRVLATVAITGLGIAIDGCGAWTNLVRPFFDDELDGLGI